MLPRCFNTLLLTAFAAVSVLGHGGLHLLPGGHDCHGAHRAADHAHDHSHHGRHHACSHRHSHHHHAGNADHSHDSVPAAPIKHDHDDCLVCQWHAQGQMATVAVVIPMEEYGCLDASLPSAQVATSFRLSQLFTRGPPRLS